MLGQQERILVKKATTMTLARAHRYHAFALKYIRSFDLMATSERC